MTLSEYIAETLQQVAQGIDDAGAAFDTSKYMLAYQYRTIIDFEIDTASPCEAVSASKIKFTVTTLLKPEPKPKMIA